MPERRGVLLERLAAANRFAEKIREFADRPNCRMDAFSQIPSGVQLNGAVFFRAECSAPWGLSTPTAKAMAATVGVGAEHLVVLYHLVIDGGAVIFARWTADRAEPRRHMGVIQLPRRGDLRKNSP